MGIVFGGQCIPTAECYSLDEKFMIGNITALSNWVIFYKSDTSQSTDGGLCFVFIILPARSFQMGVTKEVRPAGLPTFCP